MMMMMMKAMTIMIVVMVEEVVATGEGSAVGSIEARRVRVLQQPRCQRDRNDE